MKLKDIVEKKGVSLKEMRMFNHLIPELFLSMQKYSRKMLFKDITAGIIVGIIAIPLSIALAIASGAKPEAGLFTAAIAGFLIALLGGCRYQISGPTGAFVVIVYNIIEQYGYEGLIVATLLAGIIMLLMGLFKFGAIVRFIPYPITVGFTAGIALVIFSGQISDLIGIPGKLPAELMGKIEFYINNIHSINYASLLLGLLSLLIVFIWPQINKKIPGSLIAIVLITVLVNIFHINTATIGNRFGELSGSFPHLSFPLLGFKRFLELLRPAITIAILGGIESLLSAVVSDSMTGKKHNSNTELAAQGVGNIASALFGGLPATGAIARTAANIKNGGKTPVSGMVHAVVVLAITLMFMPYAKLIPMPVLAAILVSVCFNMIEWKHIKGLFKAPKSDITIFLVTFLLTVVFDLVIAIELGVLLSAILFMKRMADVTNATDKTEELGLMIEDIETEYRIRMRPGIMEKISVYRLNGPFFFGAAETIMEDIGGSVTWDEAIIIRMERVPVMDATGVFALEGYYKKCKKHNTLLFLVHVQKQPYDTLSKAGLIDKIGEEYFVNTVDEAVVRIHDKLEAHHCSIPSL